MNQENEQSIRTIGIQSAFFWQGVDLSQPLPFANLINDALGEVFDGEPAVLPVPQNVPQAAMVPRIILSSKDGRYKCNISVARADVVFVDNTPEPSGLTEVWPLYQTVLQNFQTLLKDKSPAIVVRLGVLFRLFRKLSSSGNEFIWKNYLKDSLFEMPYEANLNLLHKLRMDRFNVNRWLRLRALRNKQNPRDDQALLLEVDINTVQEEQHPFVMYEIVRFFETAYDQVRLEDNRYLGDVS